METMTPKEAAPFLKISSWTLYDMVRKRQIPHFKVRSKIFFRKEVLETWMKEQEAVSTLPNIMPFGTSVEPQQFNGH